MKSYAVNRTIFRQAPWISDYLPMSDSMFWAWLKENANGRFSEDVKGYLSQFGFDINSHILLADQIRLYKHVYDHFYYCKFHKIGF